MKASNGSGQATMERGPFGEALGQMPVVLVHTPDWFSFASEGYVLTDKQGIIDDANYAAAALLDARKGFLLGKPLGLFVAKDKRALFYQNLAHLAAFGGLEHWKTQLSQSHGPARDVALTAAAVAGESGRAVKLRWLLQDVSTSHQIRRAWQSEKSLTDCLLESADLLILLVDNYGTILRCNRYAVEVSGYGLSDLEGENWYHLLLPDPERQVGAGLMHEARSRGASSGVVALLARSGQLRRIQWTARKLDGMMLLIGHDVTQLHEAQRQALQAERLAAIGQMSAGLAHEGRNALQRIQACLSLLTVRLHDQPENLELLERIQKAEDDLHRLFEDIRTYAVAARLQPRWCDVRQCWREAWKDLGELRPSAELTEDLDDLNPFCQADPFYLKQVFRNLLENALSSGASPVRILIQCQPAVLGTDHAICIRLRDNGPGIAAEVRPQLFEPFFTTKVRGTGLGLAICKRILEAHGGRIEASNDSTSGTEMVITLPRKGP